MPPGPEFEISSFAAILSRPAARSASNGPRFHTDKREEVSGPREVLCYARIDLAAGGEGDT